MAGLIAAGAIAPLGAQLRTPVVPAFPGTGLYTGETDLPAGLITAAVSALVGAFPLAWRTVLKTRFLALVGTQKDPCALVTAVDVQPALHTFIAVSFAVVSTLKFLFACLKADRRHFLLVAFRSHYVRTGQSNINHFLAPAGAAGFPTAARAWVFAFQKLLAWLLAEPVISWHVTGDCLEVPTLWNDFFHFHGTRFARFLALSGTPVVELTQLGARELANV